MNEITAVVIRRAILDLLNDIGGEHTDEGLHLMLVGIGHRVARRDVRSSMEWLAERRLVHAEALGPFVVGRILADGRDVADGQMIFDGVRRFKTGE